MKTISRLPERDFTNIFIKIFVIPALILLIFFILIFNERYQNQIQNLKKQQIHHIKVSSELINFEFQNITADSRQLLHNTEIHAYLEAKTPHTRQLAQLEIDKFIQYQPQYVAAAICNKDFKTLLRSKSHNKAKENIDFCQTEQLKDFNPEKLRILPVSGTYQHDIALISVGNGDVKNPVYLQLAYDIKHFIDLISDTDSHKEAIYLLPANTAERYIIQSTHDGQQLSKVLSEHPKELQKIYSQTKGQFLNTAGLFTYDLIRLKSEATDNKTTWKLVYHNSETHGIFLRELYYFSAISIISIIVLFIISLIYYSLSRKSRHFHKELFEDKETGLYNKKFLEAQLPLYIEQSRHFDNRLICIFIDIDNFDEIIEQKGEESRQEILLAIAKGIQGCVRKSDIVSRLGQEQFVILMPFIEKMYIGPRTATKVLEMLNHEICYRGKPLMVSASIGISNYPQHGDQLSTILTAADLAMYDVKNSSKNGYKMADAFEL